MKTTLARRLLGAALVVAATALPAQSEVRLLGVGVIPGNTLDQSGLTELLEDGVTPNNLVGGLGSALTYTGEGDLYLALPDRGPADGTTSYVDRAYLVDIPLRPAGNGYTVTPRVVATRLLRSPQGGLFTGKASAFDATNSAESLRLDPEGVRVAGCGGSFYVSDEYGPFLYEFKPNGKRRRVLSLPSKFLADLPSANPTVELTSNVAGRQSNRGMEGLAISPDGRRLYGIMQSPLVQDGGLDASLKRVGLNTRLVEIDVHTGAVRELLYVLDNIAFGISEVLAINDHELLVLERDGKAGSSAAVKKVFKIDITEATDIRAVKQLPQSSVPAGITPVDKQLFLDMLDPAFGLAGPGMPEKLEGLAFGPDLADGRHTLLVSSDNDFAASQPTRVFVFAVDPAELPGFEPQEIQRACPEPEAGS